MAGSRVGTYNARRDNLQGFWSDVYGTQHGVMVVNSFYENVPLHLFEQRLRIAHGDGQFDDTRELTAAIEFQCDGDAARGLPILVKLLRQIVQLRGNDEQ